MKNFQVTSTEDGKKYWISRSIAVCGIIIVRNKGILLQKRGPECPDYVGAWSHTCGYLDYGETILEALKREVYEELGITLQGQDIKITEIGKNDDELTGRQNVTLRYVIEVPEEVVNHLDFNSESRGGENNEVSDVMILPVDSPEIENLEFAFNHYDLTKKIISDPRFFPGPQEKELFGKFKNAEIGFIGIDGFKKLDVIVTRVYLGHRLHVVIPDLGIDAFWSELSEEAQDTIYYCLVNQKIRQKIRSCSSDEDFKRVFGMPQLEVLKEFLDNHKEFLEKYG